MQKNGSETKSTKVLMAGGGESGQIVKQPRTVRFTFQLQNNAAAAMRVGEEVHSGAANKDGGNGK